MTTTSAMLTTGTAFGDGYIDGLRDRADHAHLHAEGRALVKYRDGLACGAQDRNDGALEPVEGPGW